MCQERIRQLHEEAPLSDQLIIATGATGLSSGMLDSGRDPTFSDHDLIRNWRGPGVFLLVMHGETLKAVIDASSYPPAGWSVVVQPDPGTQLGLRFIGRIPPPE